MEFLTPLEGIVQLLLLGLIGLIIFGSVVAFAYCVLDRILEELLT